MFVVIKWATLYMYFVFFILGYAWHFSDATEQRWNNVQSIHFRIWQKKVNCEKKEKERKTFSLPVKPQVPSVKVSKLVLI